MAKSGNATDFGIHEEDGEFGGLSCDILFNCAISVSFFVARVPIKIDAAVGWHNHCTALEINLD